MESTERSDEFVEEERDAVDDTAMLPEGAHEDGEEEDDAEERIEEEGGGDDAANDETLCEDPAVDPNEVEWDEDGEDDVSYSSTSCSGSEYEMEEEEQGRESDLEEEEVENRDLGMVQAVDRIGKKYVRPLQRLTKGTTCKKCGKRFKWPSVLKAHMKTHINPCPECEKNLLTHQKLRTHMATEHKEKIKCPMCDYANKTKSQVFRHYQLNHVMGVKCTFGGCTAYVAFNRLRTHIEQKHAAAAAAMVACTSSMRVRPRERREGSPDRRVCFDCACKFENEAELEQHVQSVHGAGIYCPHPECQEKGEERIRIKDLRKHLEEEHADDAVLPQFYTQGGRAVTMGSETTASEYAVSHSSHPTTTGSEAMGPTSSSVPSCASQSSRRRVEVRPVNYSMDPVEEEEEELEEEQEKEESDEEPGPSTSSGVQTRGRKRRRDVVESTEGKRKKTREEEDDLDEDIREIERQRREERSRGDEVPVFSEIGLACGICGKIYANTDSLRKHKARVHEKRYAADGARPKKYKCTEEGCEKAFKTPGALEDHLNGHRGMVMYTCKDCGKEFSARTAYARHLKTYHGVSIKEVDGFREFLSSVGKKKENKKTKKKKGDEEPEEEGDKEEEQEGNDKEEEEREVEGQAEDDDKEEDKEEEEREIEGQDEEREAEQ